MTNGSDGPFVLTARVDTVQALSPSVREAYVSDKTGFAVLSLGASTVDVKVAAGDVCAFRGRTCRKGVRLGRAEVEEATVLSSGGHPETREYSLSHVLDSRYDFAWGRVGGTVVDAFVDELDDHFAYFVLRDGAESFIATCRVVSNQQERLSVLVGAKVSGVGCITPRFPAWREFLGRGFAFKQDKASAGLDEIEVVSPAPADPFDVLGRTRFRGRVLATWQGSHAIVAAGPHLGIHRVDFARNQPLPSYGDTIEVAGEPATDSYRANLIRAIWRKTDPVQYAQGRPQDIDAAEILQKSGDSVRVLQPLHYGTLVRLRGRILGVSADRGVATLQCGQEAVPVDVSSCRSLLDVLQEGNVVAVIGTVVFEVPNWRSGDPFPHITGFMLVPRYPTDVTVVRTPSWWTPLRIFVVLSVLALVLLGVYLRERVRKHLAELQVRERTRLAIELHDSVTQSLSAVGLQLDAAIRVAEKSGDGTVIGFLKTAAQTLSSSLLELRNCLWDLRNRALDLPDFEAAIRKTVEPHLKGATLHVRFAVPRKDLADDLAHAVLQMIREIVSNAVRHGHARTVRIAGTADTDSGIRRLQFAVSNDGEGFDLDMVPGVVAGHFGLQGLRERVRRFGGRIEIESGRPVRVAVGLPMEAGKR